MNNRISSIDIFRALTMLLMIFVNDLWTLHDIPALAWNIQPQKKTEWDWPMWFFPHFFLLLAYPYLSPLKHE